MKRNLRLSWVRTPGGLEMKWTVERDLEKAVETERRRAQLGSEPPLAANDPPKRRAALPAWAARAGARVMRPAS